MAFENITKDSNFYQSAVGDYGFYHLEGGDGMQENCRAIQALEDSTITTTTSVGHALTSVDIPAGSVIFGRFNTVLCNSGTILAYKAS